MLKIRFENKLTLQVGLKHSTKLSEIYMIFSSMSIKENFLVLM